MENGKLKVKNLPDGWQIKKFKFIADSFKKGNGITREQVHENGDTPCIRYGEIYSTYDKVCTQCVSRTNKDELDSLQYISKGDILFACTGELVEEIGKNIVYLGDEPCLAGGDIIVAKHSQNPVFLNYAMNSIAAQNQKSLGKTKLKVVHISAAEIGNVLVALPPQDQQKKIADFLDSKCFELQSAIDNTKQTIEEYKKLKQAVITKSVTKGIRPNRKMKDSGSVWFGDVPEDWYVKKLKFVFYIKKEIAGKEGYDVLSITQRGIVVKDIKKNEGQLAADYSNYQLVNVGDFAMNHMDLLTGWVDISKYAGVTSPDYRVFQLHNQNENCSRYYLYMMQMCYMDKIFYGLGQGVSGMGRWRLQADKFLNFLITVPPKNEQSEIAAYLDKKCSQIDSVIAQKEQFITELEKYKQSLIYEYVTGKKQVSSCEFSKENSGKREV